MRTINSNNSLAETVCLRKRFINHPLNSSASFHPLLLKPYVVTGTSPFVQFMFKLLASKMTKESVAFPVAFAQPTTVTWDLFLGTLHQPFLTIKHRRRKVE